MMKAIMECRMCGWKIFDNNKSEMRTRAIAHIRTSHPNVVLFEDVMSYDTRTWLHRDVVAVRASEEE